MAKYFDADGNEVEGLLNAEEVVAAGNKAVADYQKANPVVVPKTAEEIAAEKIVADKALEPFNVLSKTVSDLQATLRSRDIKDLARTYAGGDVAKQAEFETKFGRLTGYADTAEGMAERAGDAARMVGIDPAGFDVGSISGTSGGRNVGASPTVAQTDADKAVQKALGITPEDVTKYAPQVATEQAKTN